MAFRSFDEQRAFARAVEQAHARSEDADRGVIAQLLYARWQTGQAAADWRALERSAAELKAAIALWKKYRADQPRVPAGNPNGGQWTSGGGGSGGGAGGAPFDLFGADTSEGGFDETAGDASDFGGFEGFGASDGDSRNSPSIGEAPDGTPVEEAGVLNDKPVRLEDEERGMHGGHAINGHVGRSDRDLLDEYLSRRQSIEARDSKITVQETPVGSFDSIEAANDIANQLIHLKRADIEQALQNKEKVLHLEHRFGFRTGREAWSDTPSSRPFVRDAYGVWMVLWLDKVRGDDYRIRTFFPFNRGWKEISGQKEKRFLMNAVDWDVPKEFTYLASVLYWDIVEEYLDVGYLPLFRGVIRDYFISLDPGFLGKSLEKVRVINDFVTRVLAANPSDEELNQLWDKHTAIIRWRGNGARQAFEAIRQASEEILRDGMLEERPRDQA